ncbi:DUF2279 domain-containing protein [Microbulbifer bruguierae]|uniref:DUF2279 domain-containing protein n=1 Tax=Microbulbifer bruguierae TaxID=3029061 RepID=A0ABY8NGF8_9GAMM|nr:DUF2279 domain-containing protein [Microbulbifer bruguierae]WGL17454.1 DUF2279 domain-containing protein [Microbulbifer bruguierae]
MFIRTFFVLLALLPLSAMSAEAADSELVQQGAYQGDYRGFWHASLENWQEIGLLAGGITYLGVKEWNWGNAEFKVNGEGWFGMDTGSGGSDKLGHLYSTYVMTEFLTHRMMEKGYNASSSALYSSMAASALMLYVEVFDGYSADHGFSYQDLTANTIGTGISYLKTRYPDTLGDTLDLRIEYLPSDAMDGFHPVTDYAGMKYMAVAKLNGINAFRDTPLKYFELQLGYFARGFLKNELPYEDYRTTEAFIGIGLNLDELLFKPLAKQLGSVGRYGSTLTHYYQVPGISLRSDIHQRQGPTL